MTKNRIAHTESPIVHTPNQSKRAWRFRCFKSVRGEDLIDRWHGKLSKKAQANLERTMEHLCVQDQSSWDRPHASSLGHHIYVIRFRDENRTQHRIAGHFHSESIVFVLTQPAVEKDDKYEPPNLLDIAKDNKSVCDGDFEGRTGNCFYLDTHRNEDDRIHDDEASPTYVWIRQ